MQRKPSSAGKKNKNTKKTGRGTRTSKKYTSSDRKEEKSDDTFKKKESHPKKRSFEKPHKHSSKRLVGKGPSKPYKKPEESDEKYEKKYAKTAYGKGKSKPYDKKGDYSKNRDDKSDKGKKKFGDKRESKSTYSKEKKGKSYLDRDFKDGDQFDFKTYKKEKKDYTKKSEAYNKLVKKSSANKSKETTGEKNSDTIRLNKFIANTGICSRREADVMIEAGVITVNGKVVTELGAKVSLTDKVMFHDQTLQSEKLVYILLNKPKDYLTTSDDPQNRKTVMDLVGNATKERIYPVGRLDRNTTGLLLFTNDGELTKKLTHPKYSVKKIYHVETDQNVAKEDLESMKKGVELEDGFIRVDDVQFVGDAKNKRDIGVEIHSGRNRIVRRLFEHFGYKVIRLDRVMFAGLTKKDLPRGKWRALTAQEIVHLKKLG